MSCITCVSLLPVISLMAADRYDPMLDFTSSQISWLFRLDPHLAFTSYSVRQYKGETGSHRHKHCAVPEEKLSFCFTSYCMGNDLLMEYINPPLTPKQCLPLSEEHTPGKGEEKASTGARHGPRPCGVLRPLEALALPGLALCPGPASLPESTPAESKEFFFPPPPPRRDTKGEGEVQSQCQDLGFLTPWHRCQRPQESLENLTSAKKVPETAAVARYGHMYLTDLSYLLRWNRLFDYAHRQQDFWTLTMV